MNSLRIPAGSVGIAALWILVLALVAAAPSKPDPELVSIRSLQDKLRWVESDTLAVIALDRLSKATPPDSLRIAEAMYLVARARYMRSIATGGSRDLAGQALGIMMRHRPANDLDVAEAHMLVGNVLGVGGTADSGLTHLVRALEIRRSKLAPDDTLIANTWFRCGIVRRNVPDYEGSLDDFGQAMRIWEQRFGPDHPRVGVILGEMGYCYNRMGEYDRGREVLERSLSIATRVSGPDAKERVIPLDYLAGLETDVGDHARSLDLSYEALRVARLNYGDDSFEAIRMRRNLSASLHSFGDWAGMKATLEPVVAWYEAKRGPEDPFTISAHLQMGVACVGLQDSACALSHLRHVERVVSSKPGPPSPFLGQSLAQQARVLHAMGNHAPAREASVRGLEAARTTKRPSGYTLAQLHYTLLDVLCGVGDTVGIRQARASLDSLVAEYDLERTTTAPVVSYWRARAAQSLGRSEEAWKEALEAFRRSHDEIRWNAQALPDGRALQLTWEGLRHLDLVLTLAWNSTEERKLEAWDRLVRSRGLIRSEMARRRIPISLRADSTVITAHAMWIKSQRAYAHKLVQWGSAPGDSVRASTLARLKDEAETWESTYLAALKRHRAEVPVTEIGLAEVREALRPGQALISIVEFNARTDTSRVVAFIARGGEKAVRVANLGATPLLRRAVEDWIGLLSTSPGPNAGTGDSRERACREAGRQVSRVAWEPLRHALGSAREIFLVGDGPLLDLPWQALPEGSSSYFVERGPLLRVLNTEWELPARQSKSAAASMLAVGNPSYGTESPGAPKSIAAGPGSTLRAVPEPCVGGSLDLIPLPASEQEARDAARVWMGTQGQTADVLLNQDATEAAFKEKAPGRSILHLATHAVSSRDTCSAGAPGLRGVGGIEPIEPAIGRDAKKASSKSVKGRPTSGSGRTEIISPWADRRVWIALAGASRAREAAEDDNDGLLTAEEVITLDLDGTQWVVLSACHSGFAAALPREGTLGLRRAFHLAGVRTVIASTWAVEDNSTREWMDALYKARAGGSERPAEAMKAASRTFLDARRKAGRTTHPFYWAAFTSSGE